MRTTLMPESPKPQPSDRLPKYIVEGLQEQDSETLRAVADYAQELHVYRAAQAEADRTTAADTHLMKQATADELAARAHIKEIPDNVQIGTRFSKAVFQQRHRS
ncbi:hypothetical protein [Haladaptatus sp. DFWS20]|uniref:hypothetical protein n=1 Tax=Haladaptatus sp. DFWS20 TaxID=3403467 RepID=UPI003EBB503D